MIKTTKTQSNPHKKLLQEVESQAAALSSSNPSLALQLLVSNVNSLLVILKVPIRITLVTG